MAKQRPKRRKGPTGGTVGPSRGGRGGSGQAQSQTASSSSTSQPPFGTYDPAIEAERRALERGLEDLLLDTRLERKYANKDTDQTLHDLQRDKQRGIHDIRVDRTRGLREIGEKREDVSRSVSRGEEDFSTRLNNLIHNFQVQQRSQTEAANASGVLKGSTAQASAAARAGNFERAKAPLETGISRLREDAATDMQRLGTSEGDLLTDTNQASKRLRQDVRHDTRLTEQELRRKLRDIHLRRQRAKREQAIGDVDLLQQEAFQAQQLHPNANYL